MKYYIKVIKNYVNFRGRASRAEYWMFGLIDIIISMLALILDNKLGLNIGKFPYGILVVLYGYGLLLPRLAVLVRRLHDVGKSGLFVFLIFIPLVGPLWLLVLQLRRGDEGENDFGPDPYGVTEELPEEYVQDDNEAPSEEQNNLNNKPNDPV